MEQACGLAPFAVGFRNVHNRKSRLLQAAAAHYTCARTIIAKFYVFMCHEATCVNCLPVICLPRLPQTFCNSRHACKLPDVL